MRNMRMRQTRIQLAAVLACGVFLSASCGDRSPLDPGHVPPPQGLLFDPPGLLEGLLSCSPLPYDSVTQTIGVFGGTMQIGPHTFTVPAGALAAPVAITGVVPANSSANQIRFQPAGLTFAQQASLTMSYANCNLLGTLVPKRIAHTTDALVILEFLQSFDNLFTKQVTGRLDHFSTYAVAW